jgi:hypothetical protein
VWEYPSPQQFYNALVRKGWETPEESIEMVVAIHNFLNERAWEEVMKWEKRKPGWVITDSSFDNWWFADWWIGASSLSLLGSRVVLVSSHQRPEWLYGQDGPFLPSSSELRLPKCILESFRLI